MIREGSFSDAEIAFMASAKEKGFLDGWNERMLRSAAENGRTRCLIAEENGVMQGFLTYTLGFDGIVDLEDLFVLPIDRGKGTGSALIAAFCEKIIATGAKKIFLEVRKSNVKAISVYSKFGFTVFSERKKYYADGEDAFVMLKELYHG